jgi:AraC family transcriptional regulator of adaptative response/methylated-DNA-[protein]-cysteine methyltransferase
MQCAPPVFIAGPAARPPAQTENVLFFADGQAARAAGFRACLRCTPDEASLSQRQADIITSACQLPCTGQTPTLQQLAARPASAVITFIACSSASPA